MIVCGFQRIGTFDLSCWIYMHGVPRHIPLLSFMSVGFTVIFPLSFLKLSTCVFAFYGLSVWLEVYQFYLSFKRNSFWHSLFSIFLFSILLFVFFHRKHNWLLFRFSISLLIFSQVVLLITQKKVLLSYIIIVDLSILPYSSIRFYFILSCFVKRIHIWDGCSLSELTLYH